MLRKITVVSFFFTAWYIITVDKDFILYDLTVLYEVPAALKYIKQWKNNIEEDITNKNVRKNYSINI